MARSQNIPPICLVQREQIEEVLRYQVWADAEMRQQLQSAKSCIELTELGCMTPAGARERLGKLARAMHEATREFAKTVQAILRPAPAKESPHQREAVPVPLGRRTRTSQEEQSWREWQWQATSPAHGCLAFATTAWDDEFNVADKWIQRAVHRALSLRATGEYLAVRLDGLERARRMAEDLMQQLQRASEEFWSQSTLPQCIGVERARFAKRTAS